MSVSAGDDQSIKGAVALLVYFAVALVASSSVLFLQVSSASDLSGSGLAGAISSTVLGCSAAYMRKIYLDLYDGKFFSRSTAKHIRSATLIYFVTRPLLAVPIGFVIFFVWMSGLNVSIEGKFELSGSGFLLLWGASVVAGFNTGRLIDLAVSVGRNVHDKLDKGTK